MFRNYDALDSLKVQIDKSAEKSPTYKLNDIKKETWEKEQTIESMILLLDEHNHRYGMSKLVAAAVAVIIYMAIFNALRFETAIMSLLISWIVLLIAAVFGAIATFHILKIRYVQKNIHNRTPGRILERQLSIPKKLLVILSFITVVTIGVVYGRFFTDVKLLPEMLVVVFYWYMAKGFKSASQYKFVLRSAPYVLKEIERREEQAISNSKKVEN